MVKRQLWQFQTTYIAFQIIFVINCHNCRQYQENKTLVKSFSSIKKRWNILFNQKFFLILPLKAVSPWVGLCFQDILVWCAYGNASWRHHRHDIKKGRLQNVLSSTLESLVNFHYVVRRWSNRNVHVGDFISRSPPFILLYIIRCCTRIYYLLTWANWLLILRTRFTRAAMMG